MVMRSSLFWNIPLKTYWWSRSPHIQKSNFSEYILWMELLFSAVVSKCCCTWKPFQAEFRKLRPYPSFLSASVVEVFNFRDQIRWVFTMNKTQVRLSRRILWLLHQKGRERVYKSSISRSQAYFWDFYESHDGIKIALLQRKNWPSFRCLWRI